MRAESTPVFRIKYVALIAPCCALVIAAAATLAAVRAAPAEEATRSAQIEEGERQPPFTVMPVDSYRITSPFGPRRDPFADRAAFHSGVDFTTGLDGGEVRAAGEGVVTLAGRRGAYGLLVEIDHGHGWKTRYGHLKTIEVERGDHVAAGQRIGSMGGGSSSASHMHFEVWKDKKPLDPLTVLPLPERKQGGDTGRD